MYRDSLLFNCGFSSLCLKIMESYPMDNEKVVRMDYDSMDILGISTGDFIEIQGKRKTVVKCSALYSSDEGKGIIRMGKFVKSCTQISIRQSIVLKRVMPKNAESIKLHSSKEIPEDFEQHVRDYLYVYPIMVGDEILVPSWLDVKFKCVITSMKPSGVTIATRKTKIILSTSRS